MHAAFLRSALQRHFGNKLGLFMAAFECLQHTLGGKCVSPMLSG
jgi:hypothetical protein